MRQVFIAASLLLIAVPCLAQSSKKNSPTSGDSIKLVSLNEVIVTSTRANERSGVAYSTVTDERIALRNQGQDIPYLLALTPSFIATSDGGTGIGYTGFRIRGTDANRINVTINGIPFNDSESHGSFFVNLPDFASSLASVQVQRGVGTSTHGPSAFGASINMQTQAASPVASATITSGIGSFNTYKNTIKAGTGLLKNNFAFDVRLSAISTDGYLERAAANLKSYYFAGGYYGNNTTLRFLTFGGHERTYQAWYGVIADSLQTNRRYNELGKYTDNNGKTKYYDHQVDNYTQTHYQLHWTQNFSNAFNLNVSAHYTNGFGYYEEYKVDRKYAEYKLTPDTLAGVAINTTDLIRRKWLDNDFFGLTYAFNYKTERMQATLGGAINRYDGDHFGRVMWVRNANNLLPEHPYYHSNSVKDEAAIFAKATVEILDRLHTTADLQYRHINYSMQGESDKFNSNTGKMDELNYNLPFRFFNPKFGLNYELNSKNTFYSSFSIANREPNRSNYLDNSSSTAPLPERLFNTEIGYKLQTKTVSAAVNLYYMDYKNQLVLTGKLSEIGELLTTNMPESYRRGIELMAGIEPTHWVKWEGSITMSQNKIKNFTEEGVDEYDANWNWIGTRNNYLGTTTIAYSPTFISNSLLTFKAYGVQASLQSNYVSRQFIDNTQDTERAIPAYLVNNLYINYNFNLKGNKSIGLNLQVNNVFNTLYSSNGWTWYSAYVDGERYNDLRFFPQATRNLMLSVSVKF